MLLSFCRCGLMLFLLAACTENSLLNASIVPPSSVGLTIYSSADARSFDPQQFVAQQRNGYNAQYASQVPGFGVVRVLRSLDLKQGLNTLNFADVAQFIDPTTVSLVDLSIPAKDQDTLGIKVLEQAFLFDLVSAKKLLDRYIDQTITLNRNLGDGHVEQITGKLLSNTGNQLVLSTDQGLRLLGWSNDIQLGKLPGGLITKPTLQWQLYSPTAGTRPVRTVYQTDGITWRSDYNLILNHNDTKADLGAWVTIMNLSGASYENAQLKLIAGDVQRIKANQNRRNGRYARAKSMAYDEVASTGFTEKSFFEYHMYTLPRPTTIRQNSTQQLALFPTVRDINVQKVLVYYGLPQAGHWFFPEPRVDKNLGNSSNKKVDVYIRFKNKENNKLGIPLPKGKVRVFKMDGPTATSGKVPGAYLANSAGSLEFVGEDLIDHTAKNQTVLIKIGQSFDVTGARVQTNFKTDSRRHWIEETMKITLKNAKPQAQKVVVRENLYRWTNWKITSNSDAYKKIDSRTIHFEVDVPAEGEKVVTYTVKYTW